MLFFVVLIYLISHTKLQFLADNVLSVNSYLEHLLVVQWFANSFRRLMVLVNGSKFSSLTKTFLVPGRIRSKNAWLRVILTALLIWTTAKDRTHHSIIISLRDKLAKHCEEML